VAVRFEDWPDGGASANGQTREEEKPLGSFGGRRHPAGG
jgi:hypothetical protein